MAHYCYAVYISLTCAAAWRAHNVIVTPASHYITLLFMKLAYYALDF